MLRQGGLKHVHEEASHVLVLLRSCTVNKDLCRGIKAHEDIVRRGLLDSCLDNLISMYAKCGALAQAKTLFDLRKSRDVCTWTSLIASLAQNGHGQDAVNYFEEMLHEGLFPDAVTLTCMLKACGDVGAVDKGETIHDEIVKQGLLGNSTIQLGTALVDMYAKCGALAKASRMLEELPSRDVVSWNALIAGYVRQDESNLALRCFDQMQGEGLFPDTVTFNCILRACGTIGAGGRGETIHNEIAKQGLLEKNIVLGSALVDMYAKCGSLSKAQQVLQELSVRNVVSWTALIAGYVQQGEGQQALDCFEEMKREGLSPNVVTFNCILKACGMVGSASKGAVIHDQITKQGLLRSNVVLGTALIDMYVTVRDLEKARRVLDDLPVRNVISWNALLTGYVQQGESQKALDGFGRMQREGLSPDAVTFTCVLKACGSIGAVDKGEKVHDEVAKQGLLLKDHVLANSLVDMYAKCGALAKAWAVLEELPVQDVISWTALIWGYTQWGKEVQALECLERIQHEGLLQDAATLSCILSACSRLSLVDLANSLFVKMTTDYGMKPELDHYACMVDLFGRSAQLEKAVKAIEKMPCTNSQVWSILLSACKRWGDVNVAKWGFEHAIQQDKYDSAVYVAMANIYAAAGMQQDAERIEALRIPNEAWIKPLYG